MAGKKKARHRHHHHHAHASYGHAHPSALRAKKRPRRRNPESGMIMVPASMLGTTENPAKKHHKRRHPHHHPRKRNPGDPPHGHAHLKDAVAAVGFGTVAAVAGLAGGFALSKANLKSQAANAAANVAAGAAIGGGLGMIDRAAGTVVTHNYMVAAGQWLMTPAASPAAVMSRAPRASAPRTVTAAATPALLNGKPRAMHGVDDVSGVVADNMSGFEHLQGIVADNMGALDDVGGPDDVGAFEHLQGPDEFGAPDDVGGPDDVGDADHVDGIDGIDGLADPDVLGEELGEEDIHGADELGELAYIAG